MKPKRKIPNHCDIVTYMHCGLCMQEIPENVSPADWARINVGYTWRGLVDVF